MTPLIVSPAVTVGECGNISKSWPQCVLVPGSVDRMTGGGPGSEVEVDVDGAQARTLVVG